MQTAQATYDAENRIPTESDSSATNPAQFPVQYYYDADGHRVMKAWCNTGTTCSATTAGATLTTYVHDAKGGVAMEFDTFATTANGTEYFFQDHLGSTRIMVEKTSGTVHCYDYAPFGNELGPGMNGRGPCYETLPYPSAVPGSVSNKFTGQERDAETGLDFFKARYVSSQQGRFTSPDPLGNFIADPTNPQSWNMYSYVANNPLTFIDPSGLDDCDPTTQVCGPDPADPVDPCSVDNCGGPILPTAPAGGFPGSPGWSPTFPGQGQGGGYGNGFLDGNQAYGCELFCGSNGTWTPPLPSMDAGDPEANFTIAITVIGISAAIGGVADAAGPLSNWFRYGPSYSKSLDQRIAGSFRWGASPVKNGKYLKQIPNPTLRSLNQWLRNQRIPLPGWRAADPRHFHLWKTEWWKWWE